MNKRAFIAAGALTLLWAFASGVRTPAQAASDGAALTEYEGTYILTPETDLRIFLRDGALYAESKFQPATKLTRISGDSFSAEAVGATFSFERDASGRVVAVTFDQAEKVLHAPRR